MNWYLIQTKPNCHQIASQHLVRQGFEVFLPLIPKTLRKSGKFINITTPIFPCYIFVGTQLDPVPWKTVNSTRGVSKAVTFDGIYRAVDSEIIEKLKSRCDEKNVIRTDDGLVPGDRAKIGVGPLANFVCNVEKIDASKGCGF